ncbi:hypothetical protein [Helicobacter cholecystus]|uniref:hypothetical protein n=1 Tax=Helicobacter cholecystus TaxID=45498 RepID=UPI002739F994|nr:hypothetical protein [Helicobacter cholecystus]
MKIALECQSLLLQDSLRFYLSSYLCDVMECDFVISDYLERGPKPVYRLCLKNKTLPFIPERLIGDLEAFYQIQCKRPASSIARNARGDDELKEEIQALLMEFSDKFLQVIKKYK